LIHDKKVLLEKYYEQGLENMSQSEILQLILSYTTVKDIEKTADRLLSEFGNINSVFNSSMEHIIDDDLNEKNAMLIKTIPCVSMQYVLNKGNNFFIGNPEMRNYYFKSLYSGASEERFYIISVNRHKMVMGEHLIAEGTPDSVRVSSEKIIRYAMGIKSYGIFISHNHPLTDATPSVADYELTKSVVRIMKFYKIRIFDHIIAGASSIASMKELKYGIDFDT